ncbi:MAG: mandelate racemase/muconate lactonizing protein [Chloroflexota bacterium]|nr:mandelate racemase/muconate lactonizing protein [Chloroflexota bacterium]
MIITELKLVHLRGTMDFPGEFWEERLVRPIDVYPEHKAEGPAWLEKLADGRYRMESIFVEVHTDEGVTGIGGPITLEQAFIIDTQLRALIEGADPLAHELIWDKLYRYSVHGRKGATMMAISAVDCALWDLKGKWANAPVYRLLGGPTRGEIPAYASALGYSVEPERAAARAKQLVGQGYRATKWFFREGPADGKAGMEKNVALVAALREAIGDNVDLMLDCWMSWDVPYTVAMAERLEEYAPRWLEEPVLPDKIESYAEIRRRTSVPISGGEHEYTRWGLKQLMDAEAVDVLQPDIYWCGGITETLKICAIASTYDLPVVPHGHSTPATAHLIASQPANLCPILEYLVKWNEIHQFFLKTPLKPKNGVVTLPETPGLGMELDEAKTEERKELRFGTTRWT